MKLNINIIIIALLICCSSSLDAYNLLIMGDQGQYEVFKNNLFDGKEGIELNNKNGCSFKKDANGKDTVTLYDGQNLNTLNVNDGLKNFNQIINSQQFKTLISAAHGIVFLGDVVYAESKDVGVNENTLEKWKQRLNCGWNVFIGTLQKMGVYNGGKLDSRVEILSGNHSYDVSINEENKILNQLISQKVSSFTIGKDTISNSAPLKVDSKSTETGDKTTYINNIQLITVTGTGFTVKIIDFNSSLLVCLGTAVDGAYKPLFMTKDNFSQCGYMGKFYQGNLPTFDQANNYYAALKNAITNNFTNDSKIWNVLRAHHPPINFEDGDASFYFDKTIDSSKKSLIELFEEKRVNIFFGSHIHSQAIMLLPYGTNSNINRPTADTKTNKEIEGCHFGTAVNNKVNVINKGTDNKLTYNPPAYHAKKTDCPKIDFDFNLNNEAMIVFLTGNSGRFSDPISNGFNERFTHGVVVWNRRFKNNNIDEFGFSHAIFKPNTVEVSFYEYDSTPKKENSYVVAYAKINRQNNRRKYLKK